MGPSRKLPAPNPQEALPREPHQSGRCPSRRFCFTLRNRNDGRPADGFSINYARANDPVVADLDQDPPVVNWGNYAIPSAPEGGTTTGLSVCFDTWSGNTWPSGETDIEGIILRVDNVTKARVPMATRNGACNDPTSLQTGPYNPDLAGLPDELCWAPLKVELAENGEVTVTWKGTVIVDKQQTGFLPSAGRLVFAGRTGGANQNTHVDNLKITTVAADKALVTGVAADALGVTVTLDDSGQSEVNPNTVTMTVGGAAAEPLTVTKVGKTSTVRWNSPTYLTAGQPLTVGMAFKDTQDVQITDTRSATVAPYVMIPPSYRVPTTFSFIVPRAGVYPFRCVWYEGNGGANVEWFSVTSAGQRILINDRANAAALMGFRARTATPQPKPTLSIGTHNGNVIVTFTGTLQTAPSIEGPWSDTLAVSPLTEPAANGAKFYRAKR